MLRRLLAETPRCPLLHPVWRFLAYRAMIYYFTGSSTHANGSKKAGKMKNGSSTKRCRGHDDEASMRTSPSYFKVAHNANILIVSKRIKVTHPTEPSRRSVRARNKHAGTAAVHEANQSLTPLPLASDAVGKSMMTAT